MQLEDLDAHADVLTAETVAATALQRLQWGNAHCGRLLGRLADARDRERAARREQTFADTYMELVTAAFGEELDALRQSEDVSWTPAEVATLADFLRGAPYDPRLVELADTLDRKA